MKTLIPYIIAVAFGGLVLSSCEDVIDVDLVDAEPILVVDAWLNNQSIPQEIRLTRSQPYFDSSIPPGIEDASVLLRSSSGITREFMYQADGTYAWIPDAGEVLGTVGDSFFLEINWEGNTYSSSSSLKRVPRIDSIVTENRTDEIFGPDGIYAQFFARDPLGVGDTYWIKTFKNGEFLNKPSELNIAYDAGFDPGSRIDGLIFIPPIREFINRIPDEDNEADDGDVPPYEVGDLIRVEIHSINLEVFRFMETARDQMRNGENTIFAIPLANTRGNVRKEATGELVLGIFVVSAISSLEIEVE
ncbi:MAG: DUF4249 domain-containing protein [Bacteroidota bacterium]